MKIALCFSGQTRSFEKGYEYFKRNLLDHYDVDVYIHSWKRTAVEGESCVNGLYKPKDYLFEDKLMGDYDSIYTKTPDVVKHPPRFTYSMFYSKNEVLKLIDGQYDWVISTRRSEEHTS